MSNFQKNNPYPKKSGKALAGLILTAVGLVLLFRQLDWFIFPSWLFSWPMILIIIGLAQKAKNRPNNSTWLILVVTGCLFLTEKIFPGTHIVNLGWPVIFIALGLWLILRRNQDVKNQETFSKQAYVDDDFLNPDPLKTESNDTQNPQTESQEDYLNAFSLFGSVKKNILSKTFKGGEIVNIFGGTDLDFSHADINGQVIIDLMQLFGGTKLIIPPHWRVVSEVAPIFGGVNDKRIPNNDTSGSKILILKGVSVFGGVDIKSF